MESFFFPESYQQSRAHFRTYLESVRALWPDAHYETRFLPGHPDLSQDWIVATPAVPKRLFVLTLGEHGIEGFVGAAAMNLFVKEFLSQFDPRDTGLLLFHAINPWGMHHRRRFNPNNVDLNRNFVLSWDGKQAYNPEYDRLLDILCPQRPPRNWLLENLSFYSGVLASILRLGIVGSREAILRGQYRHPRGIYFGGTQVEPETRTLLEIQRQALAHYAQIIHIDLHTGYGPRYQMSIVNAASESATSEQCTRNFHYPLVVRTDPQEFYTIHGDMTEAWHDLVRTEAFKTTVYAAAFEYGTFGDGLPAAIRSLRATLMENQLFWYGSGHPACADRIRQEYNELFYPSELAWRKKALDDTRQALQGILGHFGLISHP